jgi:hypothetical protein
MGRVSAGRSRSGWELKIPGFSTYLHPLDDTHLLSIGYDADDEGSFAYFDGVMLQIMDVEDPKKPELLQREVVGTRGSSSEALTDHLAFNYFAAKKMLAIPMTICEGGGNGMFGDVMTFTGLLVYDVSIEDGFSLHGRVPHPAPSGYYASGYSTSCSSWWTQASSPVKRSAFIEDYVSSLGDALAKISPLDDLSEDAASFPVGPVPCAGLAEADCTDNASCAPISGTFANSDQTGYVGCASVPPGQSYLTCGMTPTCAQDVATGACALLDFNCVPDGWMALEESECSDERCAEQGAGE